MYEQYIGKEYNNWTILEYSHKDSTNHPYFKCICKCGKMQINDLYMLKYGRSKSCRNCRPHKEKHGLSHDRLYQIFHGMKDRCYNPNNIAYKHYGSRGITICDDWLNNFNSFAEWAVNNGYSNGLTIDRIDFNKGYSPDNCRWVDNTTQANNKRNNHILTHKNKKYTIAQFCSVFNLPEQRIRQRINRYGIEDTNELLKPPHCMRKK